MSENLIIYYAPEIELNPFESLLREKSIYLREITSSNLENIKSSEDLNIFLINNKFADCMSKEMSELMVCPDYSNAIIFINGDQSQKSNKICNDEKVFLYLKEPIEEYELLKAIKSGFSYLLSRLECKRLHSEVDYQTRELSSLNEIGMALSAEQDYDKLLDLILSKSREVTNCDAGSLYLLEETNGIGNRLIFKLLSIRKGTLDDKERQEIESQVIHSYEFQKNIPWTKELENIPDIAHAHHEKLDGSGYPLEIDGERIPVQAKMMAITDIYDALTARDRPYKKAASHERAIDIIGYEVKGSLVDADLFDMFVKGKVHEVEAKKR